jgi:G3E family GTPase
MRPTAKTIPTFVVAGFLGAGKTTLVNSILHNSREPIAVVVNDFGEVNIDASLIASYSDDVLELTNGCVCCSVGESLADALFLILDRPRPPSSIVIEASGVADPANISAYTHLDGLSNGGTIVLIDALNCLTTASDPRLSQTFHRQLRAADLLAVTKKELTTSENLREVLSMLKIECPTVPIVDVSPDLLSQVLFSHNDGANEEATTHAFRSIFLPPVIYTDEAHFRHALSQWSTSAVRAKGIVELSNGERLLVQQVGQHTTIIRTDAEPTGIVIICPE